MSRLTEELQAVVNTALNLLAPVTFGSCQYLIDQIVHLQSRVKFLKDLFLYFCQIYVLWIVLFYKMGTGYHLVG